MKKRLLTLFLALLMLSSCSTSPAADQGPADASPDVQQEGTPEEEEAPAETVPLTELEKRADIKDSLPAVTFDDAELRISTKSGTLYEIAAEEMTGEATNDALYERNALVEERFKVKIVPVITPENDGNTQINNVKNSIMAQDDSFDLAATYVYNTGSIITEGMYLNWLNMEHNDFNQPWWLNGINDKFRVKDANYTVVGEMCVSTLMFTYGIFYNRTKGDEYQMNPTIYETIREGKWTLDHFRSLVQDVYTDMNGNGIADEEDFYGFSGEKATNLDIYTFAFDIPITKQDADGVPEIVLNSEKTISAVEKINQLYWNNTGSYIPNDAGRPPVLFKEGKILFTTTFMSQAFGQFRDMEDDYSILPYPKWDENQPKYMTGAMDNFSVLGIPTTAKNLEMISVVTESLNVESYRTLFPTYYEQVLQNKYARDPESIEMINLLMEGRNFDFATLFTVAISGLSTMFRTVVSNQNTDFVSHYTSGEKARTKMLDKVLKAYEENAGN